MEEIVKMQESEREREIEKVKKLETFNDYQLNFSLFRILIINDCDLLFSRIQMMTHLFAFSCDNVCGKRNHVFPVVCISTR